MSQANLQRITGNFPPAIHGPEVFHFFDFPGASKQQFDIEVPAEALKVAATQNTKPCNS